jgi:protein involved in polysaccharide export with SLBB domain
VSFCPIGKTLLQLMLAAGGFSVIAACSIVTDDRLERNMIIQEDEIEQGGFYLGQIEQRDLIVTMSSKRV